MTAATVAYESASPVEDSPCQRLGKVIPESRWICPCDSRGGIARGGCDRSDQRPGRLAPNDRVRNPVGLPLVLVARPVDSASSSNARALLDDVRQLVRQQPSSFIAVGEYSPAPNTMSLPEVKALAWIACDDSAACVSV